MKVCHRCGHQTNNYEFAEVCVYSNGQRTTTIFVEQFYFCKDCLQLFYDAISKVVSNAERTEETPLPPEGTEESEAVEVAAATKGQPEKSRART